MILAQTACSSRELRYLSKTKAALYGSGDLVLLRFVELRASESCLSTKSCIIETG